VVALGYANELVYAYAMWIQSKSNLQVIPRLRPSPTRATQEPIKQGFIRHHPTDDEKLKLINDIAPNPWN